MIFKNMTAKQATASKAMIGGAILIGAGVYMLVQGQYETAMLAIGGGLSVWGIRDHGAQR